LIFGLQHRRTYPAGQDAHAYGWEVACHTKMTNAKSGA